MDERSQQPEPLAPHLTWGEKREYAVPTYTAPEGVAWYHFLHGNVPGHQIDFMYRPDIPQGSLARQHFSHLTTLMKYIEPPKQGEYAFAVGNLSRDDTQHEPGHGGIAILFGFRLRGAQDHAGRRDPPFAHAIVAVDRAMDYAAFRAASLSLFDRLFARGREGPSIALYREYVRCLRESPAFIEDALRAYTAGFSDLPRPFPSSMGLRWVTDGAPQPKRVLVVYPDNAPFRVLAESAAKMAAVLYRSDIRWSVITSGRESDMPNGVMIRLVAQRDLASFDQGGGPVMRIDEVPDDEATLARQLFGARPAAIEAPGEGPERTGSWRKQLNSASGAGAASVQAQAQRGAQAHHGAAQSAAHGAAQSAAHAAAQSAAHAAAHTAAITPAVPALPRFGSLEAFVEDRPAEMTTRARPAPERVAPARMDDEPTVPMMTLPTASNGSGGAGNAGTPAEAPKEFERSARFSPAEIRAAITTKEEAQSRPREAPAAPIAPPPATPISAPPPAPAGQAAPPTAQRGAEPIANGVTGTAGEHLDPVQAAKRAASNSSEPPAEAAAPARRAPARVEPPSPETQDVDADLYPPLKPRRSIWVALFVGVTIVTGAVYFISISPSPSDLDGRRPEVSPAPPTAEVAPPQPTPAAPSNSTRQGTTNKPSVAPGPAPTGRQPSQSPRAPSQKRPIGDAVQGNPKAPKPPPEPAQEPPRGLWNDPTLPPSKGPSSQ
jgi:hypothetical protein